MAESATQQIHLIIHTLQALQPWFQEIPSQKHQTKLEGTSSAGPSKNASTLL